ncbi:MAG TPA: universal stress protein [Vicinamibacterales bacterium]|nr:universal stress protein [Vicinamibacterales bacterium]
MVIRSVLRPVDFSEASRTALHAAVRVVRQFHANLHVLFVEDPLLASAAVSAPASTDLKEELRQFVASTPDLDPPAQPVLHVVAGQPADEIVRFAEREQIDAIVMGTHGLTGVRKAFFGSTTARVLKRSTTALLMVPASEDANKGRNLAGLGSILVLTDFGPAAGSAAEFAARFAELVGARLVLVHVLPAVSAPASWSARVQAAMECRTAEAHKRMCGAMCPLEQYGPVESVIVQGNIAERVAELARTHRSGLIVMGLDSEARGARPGSTAYAVICSTPVPVLAVPAAVPDVRRSVRESQSVISSA